MSLRMYIPVAFSSTKRISGLYFFPLMIIFCLISIFLASFQSVSAQQISPVNPLNLKVADEKLATDAALFASESARLASPSAEDIEKLEALKKGDITTPEKIEAKGEVFEVFARRPANQPTITNFFAFTVQSAVRAGVPANTIILIFMLPLLATIIVVIRYVIGLPTLGILFPIALSITLLATGITVGASLLATIVLATIIAQLLLKKIRIMHMPKLALSVLMVSIFVFASLVIGVSYGQLQVKNLSIFPVLLLILLSEQIVSIQLQRKWGETILIAGTSITVGIAGFYLLSWESLRNFIILYPETIFLLIPFNIIVGRYFGLRISEYFRFSDILER